MQEVDANLRKGEPLWRETGNAHGTTLVVTDTGLRAIRIEPVVAKTGFAIHENAAETPVTKLPTLRAGTKRAMLITLLQPRTRAIFAIKLQGSPRRRSC